MAQQNIPVQDQLTLIESDQNEEEKSLKNFQKENLISSY